MSISSNDKELLKRLALAEARGEGVNGMALVIRSVLNRRESIKKGANFNTRSTNIRDIVYAPNQYQPTRDSRNSIDQSFSSQQLSLSERAYQLAISPLELQKSIINEGINSSVAKNLILSTGFDSLGGQGRINAITYKNQTFVESVTNYGVSESTIFSSAVPLSVIPFDDQTETDQLAVDPATEIETKRSNPIPVPDVEIEIENIYANLGDGELEDRIYELNEEVKVLNEKGSDLWTPEEQERYKQIKTELDQLYSVKAIRENQSCNSKQTPKGHSFPNTPDCEKFAKSVANGTAIQIYNKERTLPDPCGTSELAKINTELSNFFTAVKGLKKYADLYINGTINKLSNITSLIRNTSQIIGAILKTLINRLRDFIIDSIRKGINALIDSLLPTLAKVVKNTLVQKIVDEIFCRFKDIVQGLANLVTDFLFELVGKIVNVPFCIAEQFTNALVNNIAAIIDDAVGPLLDEINDILSGIANVIGDVFQALDFIIGFEAFLCAKPNCPEIKKFKASPWGGPLQSQIDSFQNFAPIPTASGIVGTVDDYISNIEIFGQRIGDAGRIDSDITSCDPSVYECGPPNIEIFGGGGIGAVGRAVVDNIGRTIGVDLISGGSGYTRPPFVSFIDNCEDTFTTGYAEINDQGQVTDIVMTSTPVTPPRDGRTENELPSSIPAVEVENDYVVCLSEFRIKETGIGYTINDEIRIEPDIANLEASVEMTESGQIIAINIANIICGISGRPEITINSPTGNGAVIEPIVSFIPVKDFDDGFGGTELIPDIIDGGTGAGTGTGTGTGAIPGIIGDEIANNIPNITFNTDSVIQAEIATNDREGLITTLRGRKIITERQDFTRRDIIRIVDCIS